MVDVRGVILAAGRGSRLERLTDDRPKCMVELAGAPLIDYQVAALRGGGVSSLAVVRGYKGSRITRSDVQFFENSEWASSNMFASLMQAESWLKPSGGVISYSDIIFGAGTVRSLLECPGDIAITYDPNWQQLWELRFDDPLEDAESFAVGEGGELIDIGRQPASLAEVKGQFMGLLRVSSGGWKMIADFWDELTDAERRSMDTTTLLRKLISRGNKVNAVPISSGWGEVDSETDLRLYETMLADGRLKLENPP